jgi:hypothetical protein
MLGVDVPLSYFDSNADYEDQGGQGSWPSPSASSVITFSREVFNESEDQQKDREKSNNRAHSVQTLFRIIIPASRGSVHLSRLLLPMNSRG